MNRRRAVVLASVGLLSMPQLAGPVADVLARRRAYGTTGGSARAVDVRRR